MASLIADGWEKRSKGNFNVRRQRSKMIVLGFVVHVLTKLIAMSSPWSQDRRQYIPGT